MNSLNKNHLYLSISTSCAVFIVLNFIIGPTSIFGLSEFIQKATGYFFGVGIDTSDYFLISSIPVFGLLLAGKRQRNSLSAILKQSLFLLLSCIVVFGLGLFLLLSEVGSPSANPLIPQHLRVEPFKLYSSFFIALGMVLPFLFMRKVVEETEGEIERWKDGKIER